MVLHLLIGPFKTGSGLEPVLRCEHSTYQPINRWLSYCAIGAGTRWSSTSHWCPILLGFNPAIGQTTAMLDNAAQQNRLTNTCNMWSVKSQDLALTSDVRQCTCHLHKSRPGTMMEMKWNVLFNDALNTFYLRLYGVWHMVKDHSYSEKGNPLPPHRLLFPINSKGSFICTIPQTG